MSNSKIIETYDAGGVLSKFRIVKHGADDDSVLQATASTEALLGVSDVLDIASGERVDVIEHGIAEVEFGGTVTRGDPLTSDANGKAILASPAAGVNARIIGWAGVSAVAGDIAKVRINLSQIQG